MARGSEAARALPHAPYVIILHRYHCSALILRGESPTGPARQRGTVFLLLRGPVLGDARRDYCEPKGDCA